MQFLQWSHTGVLETKLHLAGAGRRFLFSAAIVRNIVNAALGVHVILKRNAMNMRMRVHSA